MAAILTAAELKASREAVDAGVNTVSDADADAAIALAEARLYRLLGFKVKVDDVTLTLWSGGGDTHFPTQRVRTISSITEDGSTVTASTYRIEGGGWLVRKAAGSWTEDVATIITGTFGFASTEPEYILAKEAVKLLAVRHLQGTSTGDDFPNPPPGATLTGFSSESASFAYRTTEGDGLSGDERVDRLIDEIGRMPQLA